MVRRSTPRRPADSPFGPALAEHAAALPPAFREQFFLSPEHPHALALEGRMDRVWRRPAIVWPLFWLLTFPQMLFPETGRDVPATLTIVAGRDRHGRSCQRWSRTFAFARPRHCNAVMGYDAERARVVERFGAAGWLEIAWDIRFQPPDTIAIATREVWLRLGCGRLPIPRPLCLAVRAVERAVADRDDLIAIELCLTVPLLGPIFGYSGLFRLRQVGCPDPAEV